MKSITKKISLLLILSATLFLSSCLDSGSNSYIGNEEFSYITQSTTGTVYARTLAGYLITSPKINQLTPGTTAFISYKITEETEKVTIEENVVAYKVELAAEPKPIDQTTLRFSNAPNVTGVNFETLMEPLYASNEYFGDRWLFPYTYKIKKGESVRVSFYKAEQESSESKVSDVLIDVRLEILGTPEDGASVKTEGDYIVVDMSALRLIAGDEVDSSGNLSIKFRYYRADDDKIHTSNKTYSIVIKKK